MPLKLVSKQPGDRDGADARPALGGVQVVDSLERIDPLANRQAREAGREVDVAPLRSTPRSVAEWQPPDASLAKRWLACRRTHVQVTMRVPREARRGLQSAACRRTRFQ